MHIGAYTAIKVYKGYIYLAQNRRGAHQLRERGDLLGRPGERAGAGVDDGLGGGGRGLASVGDAVEGDLPVRLG